MELKQLLADITYEIDAALSVNEDGGLPHELFLQWCVDQMTEAGETEDVILATEGARGRAVHGYSYSDHDGRLDVFISDYKRASEEYPVYKTEFDQNIKRLENFLTRYFGKNENDIEISSPVYDLVEIIQKSEINLFRMFMVTDGRCTIARTEDKEIGGITVQTHVWDIARFLRNKSSENYLEDTDVMVTDYGHDSIPCSSFFDGSIDKKIKTYVCVFPGNFLADIYQNYSSRLLERNVRAFLSFKNKINRGILTTIEDEPENFIAYNNGLTATARSVELTPDQNGIKKIYGLQIVNGGQTTNTIYRAKHAEKLDLSQVYVTVKLCVLSDEYISDFAPKIADFANKQSLVKKTDLSSNNNEYRELEKSSRNVFAPAVDGAQRETKWFFERARGQYMDAVGSCGTPARKKQFELEYPRDQKFDKGSLAQCWGIWYQNVEDVSLGTEKYHPIFIEDIEKNKNKFDKKDRDASFKRLVSMIVLRKSAYKQIRKEKYGYSYPGSTTDYTVALISHLSTMRINLDMIWKNQKVPEEFIKNVDHIAPIVGDTIKSLCDKHGVIAKELAKGRKVGGKTLWEILIDKNLKLTAEFIFDGPSPSRNNPIQDEKLNETIQEVKQVGPEKLWALATWAKETNNLQPWQRGIVASVAKRLDRDLEPSEKQANQLIKAMKEAEGLGFVFGEI